jgi:large subunit ribosomal protein L5
MARLRDRYRKDVIPHLMKEMGYGNVNQVPRLDKVVLNMGLGEAIQNAKVMDSAVAEITTIVGQKPVVTKSKKAIANFKLRENMAIGCAVCGERMYNSRSADELALPRAARLRRVDRAFDGRGNYSSACASDHLRIDLDKIDKVERCPSSLPPRATPRARRCCKRSVCPSEPRRTVVAKTCLRIKAERPPKFKVRGYNRCPLCGRPRAFYRRFKMCRLCLRDLARKGLIPGLTKASW